MTTDFTSRFADMSASLPSVWARIIEALNSVGHPASLAPGGKRLDVFKQGSIQVVMGSVRMTESGRFAFGGRLPAALMRIVLAASEGSPRGARDRQVDEETTMNRHKAVKRINQNKHRRHILRHLAGQLEAAIALREHTIGQWLMRDHKGDRLRSVDAREARLAAARELLAELRSAAEPPTHEERTHRAEAPWKEAQFHDKENRCLRKSKR